MALVTIFVFLPIYYFVIWFEHFGHAEKRTLINQLISFTCKVVMFYIGFGVSGDTLIAMFGPFPSWYCYVHLIF